MSDYCVTFGQRYAREVHPINPNIHPETYVVIQATDTEDAVIKAFGLFNAYWQDVQPACQVKTDNYPRGELKLWTPQRVA